MKLAYTERIISRLRQLAQEVANASFFDRYDRLRAFEDYCKNTPAIAFCLSNLPQVEFDVMEVSWPKADQLDPWAAGKEGYARRWVMSEARSTPVA